jgi:SAM-dependent methyltransferase
MPLAYYSRAATAQFWSEHWGGHSVEELLRVAQTSPLTSLLEQHLPRQGSILEAGCGLGQYVLLLRKRGYPVVGADWSAEAVAEGCRAGAPLAVMDLRRLGVRDGLLAAYVSLGVVEHDPEGPQAILAEAARVLTGGGTVLVSVPYWNGLRRLAGPALAWRNRRVRAAGGQFYQFAFTRAELGALLEAHGFSVRAFHAYDPARILRLTLMRLVPHRGRRETSSPATGAPPSRRATSRALRALLYSSPGLRFFGHMLLAVGIKR